MNLEVLCKTAHDDRIKVGMLDTDVKNETLRRAADKILSHEEEILAANAVDVTNGKERNMPAGLLDRLTLNHDRLEGMADGLRQIAKLDDPIGEVLSMKKASVVCQSVLLALFLRHARTLHPMRLVYALRLETAQF